MKRNVTKQKRIVALILAAAICLVMLFSDLYIIAEANHHCIDGSCCLICERIKLCLDLSCKILFVAFALAATTLLVGTVRRFSAIHSGSLCSGNLIALKVKLSN